MRPLPLVIPALLAREAGKQVQAGTQARHRVLMGAGARHDERNFAACWSILEICPIAPAVGMLAALCMGPGLGPLAP
jgi:hypothetical protein